MKQNNKFVIKGLLTLLFGIKGSITERYLITIQNMRNKNGLIFTIKYMKCVKLHITRYVCGQPLHINSSLVSVTKEGFPTQFLYLKEFIDSKDFIKIRGVMTLLSYTRAIVPTKEEELKVKLDFSTIDKHYTGKEYSIPKYFVESFVKKHDLKSYKPKFDNKLHYISSKSSPFGKSTLTGNYALFHMINISHSMLENFLSFIGEASYKLLFTKRIQEV